MALAAPVLEQTYRYRAPSTLVGEGDQRQLRLATSGGPCRIPSSSGGRSCVRSSRPTCCSRSVTSLAPGSTSRPRCSRGSSSSPIRSPPVRTIACGLRRSPPAAACTDGSTSCPTHTTARRSGGARPTSTSVRASVRPWRASRTGAGSGWPSARPRWRSTPTGSRRSSGVSPFPRAGSAASSKSRRSRPSSRRRPTSMDGRPHLPPVDPQVATQDPRLDRASGQWAADHASRSQQ